MLKIVSDKGEILCEFNDAGIFGMIDNAFLFDVASGKFDKNEIRAIFYLMHTCNWSNKVEKNASHVSKILSISQKTYYDIFDRLIEKSIILHVEDCFYINPALFRRRRVKKDKQFTNYMDNKKLHNDPSKYSFDNLSGKQDEASAEDEDEESED